VQLAGRPIHIAGRSHRLSRAGAIALVYVLIAGGVSGGAALVLPSASDQINDMRRVLRRMRNRSSRGSMAGLGITNACGSRSSCGKASINPRSRRARAPSNPFGDRC
jgi:hypothetical protein